MVKCNLEAHGFRMAIQSQEKFPPAKIGDTVKLPSPDVDRGRCNSRNLLGMVVEIDSRKGLYKIGTTQRKLNSWYARNQFSTCTEEIFSITHVPSKKISLQEYAEKVLCRLYLIRIFLNRTKLIKNYETKIGTSYQQTKLPTYPWKFLEPTNHTTKVLKDVSYVSMKS